MADLRRLIAAATLGIVPFLMPVAARALDGGMTDAMSDAVGNSDSQGATDGMMMSSDGGHTAPVCPDAITSATGHVMFRRMGPVDFGPGTGMMSVGSHDSLGLDYNLLFSGTYDTGMAGVLDVNWPRALTVTTVGDPMGGYLDVTYGLRMTATLWVAGLAIPLPLDTIIDDHEGHGRSMFTPWAYNYEGTNVHLNVSAWRTIYSTTLSVSGHDLNFELQMRYNVDASVRTVEIGFPDPSAPATMERIFGTITATTPSALIPPPRDGSLDLLTRWKPQLRYQGSFEFRINPSCADALDLVCQAAAGLLGLILQPVSTPPFVSSHDTLGDPYDQAPHFDLPIEHIDQTEIDFGDVHIGESVQLPLTVNNPGRSTLALDPGIASDPMFAVGPGTCIPAAAMAQIPLTFHPTHTGTFMATLEVVSNGITGSPTEVTLVGNGVTTSTRPPGSRSDAGRGDGAIGDGGQEYHGPQIDAGCGCRTAGAPASGPRGMLAAVAFAALAMAARRRQRTKTSN